MKNNTKQKGSMDWLIFHDGCRTTPKWKKTVGISDGVVFLPAKLFGNETLIFMGALYDCNTLSILRRCGKLYLPIDVLVRFYPKRAEKIQQIEKRALELWEKNKID